MPQEIRSKRLVLRRFEPTDLDAFTRFMTDPESTRYLAFTGDMKTPSGTKTLLESTIGSYDSESPRFALAAAGRESRTFLGMCGLSPLAEGEVEIFYAVVRHRWGEGLASEIAVALSRYCFEELGVGRVTAFIVPGHVASTRVAQKAGLRCTGLVDNANFSEEVFRYTKHREAT